MVITQTALAELFVAHLSRLDGQWSVGAWWPRPRGGPGAFAAVEDTGAIGLDAGRRLAAQAPVGSSYVGQRASFPHG